MNNLKVKFVKKKKAPASRKLTEKEKKDVIDCFYKDNDNRILTLASKFNVSYFTIDRLIDQFFKNIKK